MMHEGKRLFGEAVRDVADLLIEARYAPEGGVATVYQIAMLCDAVEGLLVAVRELNAYKQDKTDA